MLERERQTETERERQRERGCDKGNDVHQPSSTCIITDCVKDRGQRSCTERRLQTMSISGSPPSSSCIFTPQNPSCPSPVGTLPLNPDSTGQTLGAMANQMPQMDAGLYGQSMGPQGFPKFPDTRNMEQIMGLSYLPYSSCLTSTNTERAAQQTHHTQQDFSQFLLPPPAATLRQSGQKRGLSKDSMEYRLRRERNNIAVRKSRDKARRRIQLTQQRALQLQDENHRLQLHIQRLSHEVDTLKHFLSQRHLQAKEQEMGGEDTC